MEGGDTIIQLARGTDRDVYSSQFEAAADEMRVLRRFLAHREFISATESVQGVLALCRLRTREPQQEAEHQSTLVVRLYPSA